MRTNLLIALIMICAIPQTTPAQCALFGDDIACDDFSSNNNSGGTGWSGNWGTSGSPSFTGGQIFMNGGSYIDVAISIDGGISFLTTLFTKNGNQICPSSNDTYSDTVTVQITTKGAAKTIAVAILTSSDDEVLQENFRYAEEIGLSGEIKLEQRVEEPILKLKNWASQLYLYTNIIS